MNEVLKEHIGKFCYVFLDDIIIYSPTFASHLEHLMAVFRSLRDANLKLSTSKCRFATASCTFLGFCISETGLSCDPRLIEAIAQRPEPYKAKSNPKKAVASFVGLCSFYRRFVKGFAEIAQPLTQIMGKNAQFKWGPEQQEAFDTLKRKLMSYPILRRPDFSRPFFVHTDASLKAVGAVLTQKDDEGREYTVAYHSAKLTPTQANWGITHLECYAVVNAVCDHWKDFLLGHEFTVVTDHVALRWLMTCPKLQGKLARWSLRLQEFQPFTIQYRKGALHKAADALSRDPRHDDDYAPEEETPQVAPQATAEEQLTLTSPPSVELDSQDFEEVLTMDVSTPTDSTGQGHEETETEGTTEADSSQITDSSLESTDSAEPPCVRICIEGNIGSGKTTVVKRLLSLRMQDNSPLQDWLILSEPVQDWEELLRQYYRTPPNSQARHALATLLQVAVLDAYALRVPHPAMAPLAITERGPWSSLAVFLPTQRLPPTYERVVSQTAHHMHHNLDNALPTAIVYLKSTPEECLRRIQRRQRPGEEHITLQYLQQLHDKYEAAIQKFPGPTYTIDASLSEEAIFEAVKRAVLTLRDAKPPANIVRIPEEHPATPFRNRNRSYSAFALLRRHH